MPTTPRRTIGGSLAAVALLLALGVLLLAPPARSADVVNVTFNVPAAVYDNPCLGEPVALHGDFHLLVSADTDPAGGYHYLSKWNASYSGTGLVSGAEYKASERKQESWTASQLPASHTTTSVVKLVSKGGAPNAFITTTFTTTIGADGVTHGDRGQRVGRLPRLTEACINGRFDRLSSLHPPGGPARPGRAGERARRRQAGARAAPP